MLHRCDVRYCQRGRVGNRTNEARKKKRRILVRALSRLGVLSGALKVTDKCTVAMEAVGDKIRLNCQGWEDAKVLGERQVLMVVAIKGQLYLLSEHRPAKFERVDHDGLNEAGTDPTISNEEWHFQAHLCRSWFDPRGEALGRFDLLVARLSRSQEARA
jgi:hypothetical protein